jgi:hypothetical protein
MHYIPSLPKCFRSCKGSLLNPELLFALKWYYSTAVSSAWVMWFAVGFSSGLNLSGGIVASINMCSLYSANSFSGISSDYVVLLFNRPQNYFGFCLSMSGNLYWSRARPSLHCLTNAWNMLLVCAWFFPFFFTARRYLSRAFLHCSSYHGAMCLSHLFGFFALRLVVTLRTPAFSASSNMNVSILFDLSSLSVSCALLMALKAAENSGVAVCSAHFFALVLYSWIHSPSIHLYAFYSSIAFVFFTDSSVLGWPTLYTACGPDLMSSWAMSSLWDSSAS